MGTEAAIRIAALWVPVLVAGLLYAVPSRRKPASGALLLAMAWNLVTLPLVHGVSVRLGWWRFGVQDLAFAGLPIDLLLGWIVLWGAVAALVAERWSLTVVVLVMVWLDALVMPLMAPVVELGKWWLAGEALAVGVCLIPGLLLCRWTDRGRNLAARATLQVVTFTGLALWLVPEAIIQQTGGNWGTLAAGITWGGGAALQVLAIPAILGLSAVQEFVVRGGGTPVPFDPPQRLVTSGPYAYVRNPMQIAAALLFLGWGWAMGSAWVGSAGAMVLIYGMGFAAWDEGRDLRLRYGPAWERYRSGVRAWIPRWRPYTGAHAAGTESQDSHARLYVSAACGKCSRLGAWFAARGAQDLGVIPAELHPSRDLSRITYDPGDGTAEVSGMHAIGRGLEHIHLGWALLGMTIRLPGVSHLTQMIADVSGGAPMRVERWQVDGCELEALPGAPMEPSKAAEFWTYESSTHASEVS